ncbi:MAG TPA: hypothetical protein VGR32_01335 [Brevundimonas sp.]|jgi:hypothetical protein|uniref:hypothetical protein n=1 Tax=Brevundimonas sp. TaxID=1871086 RepID=UPI002DE9BE23|nr:hypothetical protein [Brevundimonas sp.]
MILAIVAAASALAVQGFQDGWTWTLYEDGGTLVLAHEIPDTEHLRATLECEAGSGAATVRVYGFGDAAEFSQLRAGQATAQSQSDADADGSLGVGLRIDHPVFAAFSASGRLDVASAGRAGAVTLDRANLAKLRRFGELCAG